LFFSGLSFVGYLARRVAGRGRGYAIAGTLGGLLSSTSVTLTLSRLSRAHPSLGRELASGVLGANVVLFPRVWLACVVIEPAVAFALWPAFVAPVIIGCLLVWRGMHAQRDGSEVKVDENPLQIRAALQMALMFQIVLFGVAFANEQFGQQGLLASAAVLGLTDVDALTLSMARMSSTGMTPASTAAMAITVGIIVNTLVKLGIAMIAGRGRFRPLAGTGLAAMALALGLALYWN
jgi:uncharacterized membrane protein (DUF4010 family)